jgi:hypothetical protein
MWPADPGLRAIVVLVSGHGTPGSVPGRWLCTAGEVPHPCRRRLSWKHRVCSGPNSVSERPSIQRFNRIHTRDTRPVPPGDNPGDILWNSRRFPGEPASFPGDQNSTSRLSPGFPGLPPGRPSTESPGLQHQNHLLTMLSSVFPSIPGVDRSTTTIDLQILIFNSSIDRVVEPLGFRRWQHPHLPG